MEISVSKLDDIYIWGTVIQNDTVTGHYTPEACFVTWTSSHQVGLYHTNEIDGLIEKAVEEFIKQNK